MLGSAHPEVGAVSHRLQALRMPEHSLSCKGIFGVILAFLRNLDIPLGRPVVTHQNDSSDLYLAIQKSKGGLAAFTQRLKAMQDDINKATNTKTKLLKSQAK